MKSIWFLYDDLAIWAPCPECVRLWLPRGLFSDFSYFEIDETLPDPNIEGVCVLFEDGKLMKGEYYPHPECKRHPVPVLDEKPILKVSDIGPIKKLLWEKTPPGAPYVAITWVDPPRFIDLDSHLYPLVGRGVDFDPEKAKLKAFMEGIERYCTCMPHRSRMVWGKPQDFLNNLCLPLDILGGEPRWWCLSTNLTDSKKNLIPVEYAQLASITTVKQPIVHADSTGMAIHFDKEEAILTGLAEVLERVGVKNLCSKDIPWIWNEDSLCEGLSEIIGTIKSLGYKIIATADQPVKNFYSTIAILYHINDNQNRPSLVCGSGGSWDNLESLKKALFEAYSQLVHALDVWPKEPKPGLPTNYDHFLYYLLKENGDRLLQAWKVWQAPEREFKRKTDNMSTLADKIKALERDVLIVDRGNSFTDSQNLYAYQVIIPSLWPQPFLKKPKGPMGLPYPFA